MVSVEGGASVGTGVIFCASGELAASDEPTTPAEGFDLLPLHAVKDKNSETAKMPGIREYCVFMAGNPEN